MTLQKFKNFHYHPPLPQTHLNINTAAMYSPIDTNSEYIYVDIESVKAISTFNNGTTLHIEGIGIIQIKEHITEVIAILEGRDPAPSKILFGNKK